MKLIWPLVKAVVELLGVLASIWCMWHLVEQNHAMKDFTAQDFVASLMIIRLFIPKEHP